MCKTPVDFIMNHIEACFYSFGTYFKAFYEGWFILYMHMMFCVCVCAVSCMLCPFFYQQALICMTYLLDMCAVTAFSSTCLLMVQCVSVCQGVSAGTAVQLHALHVAGLLELSVWLKSSS